MPETTCPRCGSARLVQVKFLDSREPASLCESCNAPPVSEAQLILAELRAIREQLELLTRSVGPEAVSPLPVTVVS